MLGKMTQNTVGVRRQIQNRKKSPIVVVVDGFFWKLKVSQPQMM